MMERRQIVELWQQGRAGVLVTLVRAEGSSYRRPGARLLTAADERRGAPLYAGTISGGCLEGEVVRKAAWKVREGAHVERYSMLFDDTAEIPFGLGCGGVVDLLFEPAQTPEARALLAAMQRSLAGESLRVVTFLPSAGGPGGKTRGLRRLIVGPGGDTVFASDGLAAEKIACAARLAPGGDFEGRFVEQLQPPQRLIVLGAGDDARPLVRMAALLGWTVAVADGRAPLARAERFPEAAQVIALDGAASAVTALHLTAADAVVLMTHSFEQDRDLLAAVLPVSPRYLGLLGSRHRSSLLVAEVAERLGRCREACCEHLCAPVGLDLGGDGPEAIALAIVSEAQAVCQGRRGVSDRLTEAEIARQLDQGGGARYQRTQCAMDAIV